MNLNAIVEGLLFVSGEEGISLATISDVTNTSISDIEVVLEHLQKKYNDVNSGIALEKINNKYKLITKKDYYAYYQKLASEEQNECLSKAALETLAIIAYNEPVTRIMIDQIRGVGSAHIVRKLSLKNLIHEVGRSELPGRPKLYGVTDGFLNYFGLKSTKDLPKITEDIVEQEVNLFSLKSKED